MQKNKKWDCNFELGNKLTQEQLDFFDKHGVIIFRNFITPQKVQEYLAE
jgi:phytanoyl-CoA hydroxylase